MTPVVIETERLVLGPWQENDFAPLAALCADPEVMRFFPKVLSTQECRDLQQRMTLLIAENGWGFWAAHLKNSLELIGLIGIIPLSAAFPFAPGVEVGWRLAKRFWGKGYATEGARAALDFAFNTLELPEVVALTAHNNVRSQQVMQRIGMTNTSENFFHPNIAAEHPLAEHVLYKINQSTWRENNYDDRTKPR